MKRVRCPKCDEFVTFDETKYNEGQALVFVCPQCGKQFGVKIGKFLGFSDKKRGYLIGLCAIFIE